MKRRLLALAIIAVGLLVIAAQCPFLSPGDGEPGQPPGSPNPDPTPQPPAGPCDCTGVDLDCGDFSTHSAAQSCFDYCKSQGYGDVFGLDGDDDGDPCESLP